MYRDSSIASWTSRVGPKLFMMWRVRWFVMGFLWLVLRNMLLSGIAFLELVLCIPSLLRICCVSRMGAWVRFMRLLVCFMKGYLILFHRVVVLRRDEAIWCRRNWLTEDSLVGPYRWLRPDLVPPAPFLQCDPSLTPGVSGVLADLARIDDEFREAWLPYFCRSGRREASLEEFDAEFEDWLPLLPEVHLSPLSATDLLEVVKRETATVGSLDGWGWREPKTLPDPWFDGLVRISAKVEELGVWPEGLIGCVQCYDP